MRLADSARHCVVFLGFPGNYGGTAFLVGLEEEKEVYRYLVTARHVAIPHLDKTPFVIRANLKDGTAEDIDVDIAEWICHPDINVDVAVLPFVMPPRFESALVLTSNFVNEATRKENGNIGVGSLAYIIGLFRLHRGKTRNLPIVHTGHIALEPSGERIPVRNRITGEDSEVDGYLVEAQTLEGLSGSPVFARRSIMVAEGEIAAGMVDSQHYATAGEWDHIPNTPYGHAPVFDSKDLAVTSYMAYGPAFLLGLWQGAWDGQPGNLLAADRDFDNKGLRVPVGMGITVPADKILETLNTPRLQEGRRSTREEAARKYAAVMDSAFAAKSAPPATEQNPRHREDFSQLVTAAVKKPQQDG